MWSSLCILLCASIMLQTSSLLTFNRGNTKRRLYTQILLRKGLKMQGLDDSEPSPFQFPRERMELPFAVQLMRVSYNITDTLNFVPMDEFQKSFFLFRQALWEAYRKKHPTVVQGDLADPVYFDFISFAQYCVIAEKMASGISRNLFLEKVGADGKTSIARRSEESQDIQQLPALHSRLVGDSLLSYIESAIQPVLLSRSSFVKNGQDVGINVLNKDSTQISSLQHDIDIVLKMLLQNKFASSGFWSLEIDQQLTSGQQNLSNKKTISMTLSWKAPINYWSLHYLLNKKVALLNDFDLKIVGAIARRYGYQDVIRYSSKFDPNGIDINHQLYFI